MVELLSVEVLEPDILSMSPFLWCFLVFVMVLSVDEVVPVPVVLLAFMSSPVAVFLWRLCFMVLVVVPVLSCEVVELGLCDVEDVEPA